MLRHDPFAPMARAEMADRWQGAERARLCRAAQKQRTAGGEQQVTTPPACGWLGQVVRLWARGVPASRDLLKG